VGNGKIILPHTVLPVGTVVVREGVIRAVLPKSEKESLPPDLPFIDVEGNYISPGLVELHIHGCGPYGFEALGPGELRKAAGFLASRGVSLFVPTIQPDQQAVSVLGAALRELLSDRNGSHEKWSLPPAASAPGLYLEGPFINPEKRGGILPELVHHPDPALLNELYASSRNTILLMTVAPEVENIESLIPAMLEKGIVPCLGHSDASVAETEGFMTALRQDRQEGQKKQKKDGARRTGRPSISITHLFNAMAPISHKRSGLAMVPFVDSGRELFVEVNGDGIHLNADMLRFCYRNLDHDHILLISDAVISAGDAGLQNGEGALTYFGKPVDSDKEGVRYRESGTLIGSNRLIPDVVHHFVEATGAPLCDAVRFAALNPCRVLGLDHVRGSLEPGKLADIVVFDADMNVIREFCAPLSPVRTF
jgi:N-acetylglucosamine-6-phosphate deacetylase